MMSKDDRELIERLREYRNDWHERMGDVSVLDDAIAALSAATHLEALQTQPVGELRAAAQDALKALELSVQSFPDVERKLRAALTASPPVVEREAVRAGPLQYTHMGSGGRCDFNQLREAVSEATCGSRDAPPFDPTYYPGHQMVSGINYNSLDRIVTAFVDDAILALTPVEGVGES